jgi:hypothetical protein
MEVDNTGSQIKSTNIETLASRKKQSLPLFEIAKLSVAEYYKHFASAIPVMVDDFLNDPEMTEFLALDGEDWEIANDCP